MPTRSKVAVLRTQPETVLEDYQRLAEAISLARKTVIPGVAHYPNMERPAEFNRAVLDFLVASSR